MIEAADTPKTAAESEQALSPSNASLLQEDSHDPFNEELTAQELKFASLVAQGYSQTTAYRKAFPAKANLKYNTVRVRASELVAKSSIYTEIQTAIRTQARLARQAEGRIEEILTDGSIHSKTNKVADVAMFMYEQANGKATIKVEQKSQLVAVVYNLGGNNAPPMPREISDKLNAG